MVFEVGNYDVLVVGAGLAGSSAAYFLSKSGLKVLIVDVKPPSKVGDKPCGDAIGKHHFDELGLDYPTNDMLEGFVKGIDVYSPTESMKYRVLGEGFEVDRVKYTQYLLKKALDGGVEFLGETQAVEPIVKDGFVVGATLWSRGRGKWVVNSKVVIDASGVSRSLVRKLDSLSWPVAEPADPKDFNIAYREVRKLSKAVEEPEILRIYVSKTVAPGGYWWFFPYSIYGDVVNVGLGVQGGVGYPHPKDLLYKYVFSRDVFKGSQVLEAGGAAVPTRRPVASLVWNGVAVVGDAAYAVNPVHGGGKGPAMVSSMCVSKAVVKALDEGVASAENLWSANLCFMSRYGAKQASLDVFRIFLQKLSDEDLEYGMSRKLIKEEDLNTVSLKGDLELSVVDKALRLLSGLRRPSLLIKLKVVADYMSEVKKLYLNYPEKPSGLKEFVNRVEGLFAKVRSEF
ncbi:MAG: geranylgeranyl hydrogenase [Zestosphaera tikiterensis]|uniref:Geranylgeranyl hydrogenase n=1 Tax=Zestosphaera tikiterensis TaxID=1973259 RepID=A0A2R7Y832_9CREN|nr:MAG: geranylgeranyl hydrogenase [Zestosphaera tikiterensis]